jgi:GH35 family endo-1,4-beta-xylanase
LRQADEPCKNRIALAAAFPQHPPMLARVLSAAVNGIEAFPVEVEVNSGWGDTIVVILSCILPMRDFTAVQCPDHAFLGTASRRHEFRRPAPILQLLKWAARRVIPLALIGIPCFYSYAGDGYGVPHADDPGPPLKDSYLAAKKELGTSIMPMGMGDAAYMQLLLHHFSLIIPDYGMYMSDLQPKRGQWSFDSTDQIMNFAKTNSLKVRGHVLVYDYPMRRHEEKWTPTPNWVYAGKYSRADMVQIMCEHIDRVMKRYQDSVSQWIVVNEAVGNALPGEMEDNIWRRTIGEDYVELAFIHAHQVAPNAELLINDYGADYLGQSSCGPFKVNNFYRYVRKLRQKGIPIDGVGLQFHLTVGLDHPNLASIEDNFARYRALGVKVYITELDVKIKEPVTEDKLGAQAALYGLVMNAALNSPNCSGLSVWGYTDRYSWITTFHAFAGYTNACLFDSELNPKKGVLSLLHAGNN